MSHPLDLFLSSLLEQGPFVLGQIRVEALHKAEEPGRALWRIAHIDTPPGSVNRTFYEAREARFIARYDSTGAYRPLKGSPNLPTDWELLLTSITEVRLALDDIYPAALGMLVAKGNGDLRVVPFTEKAGRQTGMYRIVGIMEPDLADRVVAEACAPDKCLRTILRQIRPGTPPPGLPPEKFPPDTADLTQNGKLPFLCAEPCNLLIAACRTAIKREQKKREQEGSAPH